jgi:glycosyltransferase involved in cell wall biosynthesis
MVNYLQEESRIASREPPLFKKKPRIAVLGVKGLPFTGGLEIIMEEIGQRFVRYGYAVDVFVRKHYMTGNPDLKTYKGIDLCYSWGIHSKHLDAISHSLTAILKALSRSVDIFYINAIGISLLAFIPKLFGKKVIVQVHGLDFRREKWGEVAKAFLRFSCLTTVWFADRIICVSAQDKNYFDRRFGVNCIFIPNGVARNKKLIPDLIRQKWGLNQGSFILFMARLVKEKGCHLLLDAYQQIDTDKILVVAGDNSHREAYSEDLKKLASNRIRFVGFVDGMEKDELLSNAFCYVLPSTLEAMPMSLLEAMSFGNCILASDLADLKSVLGDAGLFFKAGDATDLKDKLLFVLSNPDLAIGQGSKALVRAESDHNWDTIFEKYHKVVKDLLMKC